MASKSITRQSKLFPDEPHYIPGYRGYCPQMNFKMGDTYGKTTHGILTDGNIAKSSRRVLAQTSNNASHDNNYEAESEEALISKNRRAISFGDKKLTHNMVPGYTGYIPKKEDHFGNRYAVGCHRAICNFEGDRTAYSNRESDRLKIAEKPPQIALRKEPAPYVSVKQAQHSVSPYFMDSGDPGKTFMSGYTGFIPCARSHFANVYRDVTCTALTEFTEDRTRQRKVANRKIDVGTMLGVGSQGEEGGQVDGIKKLQAHSIYRNREGLLPRYTGYLPGHKYRYGITFGTSARYYHNKVQ